MSTLGKRCLPPLKGTADVADHPLRRRLRHLGARHQEDTEALREDVAQVLARMGLRLSAAKTQVVHMSDGFDFLGFRIRWKRKRGTNKWYVYTFIADRPLRSVKAKIRALTHKTSQWDLASVLTRLGQIMRGWANYFKHAVAKIDLRQTGHLHIVEARPHAAGPPPLELGSAPSPSDRPHRAVVDGRGRGRVLPDRGRNRFSLRLPRYPDPYPLAQPTNPA